MKAIIHPGLLSGTIEAIPSKSEAHRLLICAALASSPTRIELARTSEDIEATLACIENLGCTVQRDEYGLTVHPGITQGEPFFDCRESGSTLRFMVPVAAALFDRSVFTGCGRLPQRPMAPLMDAMQSKGVSFSENTLPFTVTGRLLPGEYEIAGNVSSQYITGLLMALPLLEKDSIIRLTTPLESEPYIDITLSALKKFGILIEREGDLFKIHPGAYTSPYQVSVGGDWSNSAFFLTAASLGSAVTVTGLDSASPQGDRAIVSMLAALGHKSGGIKTIDISQTPDLLPILSVAAAMGDSKCIFTGAARLKAKESDRLLSCTKMINDLGGRAECTAETLTVEGTGLSGGEVDSFGDHRIAMAAAVAGTVCSRSVTINGAQAVNKSYPGFFDDFIKLGGKADVI